MAMRRPVMFFTRVRILGAASFATVPLFPAGRELTCQATAFQYGKTLSIVIASIFFITHKRFNPRF